MHIVSVCATPSRLNDSAFVSLAALGDVAGVATKEACHILVENPENPNPPRLVGLKDPAIHIL